MKLHSIPYYIEFVGQPIPGTDRKTQNLHVLLFGLILSLDNTQSGCYASKEKLAERLHTTPTKIRDLRTDLIRLGWISVIKNSRGEITNLYANEVQFIPVNIPQDVDRHPTGCHSDIPQVVAQTGVRPQSENKVKNKVIKPDFDKSGSVCSPLENAPKDEPDSVQSPFGDNLNRTTIATPTNLKRVDDKQTRDRRKAYAIANSVRKRLGLAGAAGSAFKQGVERWLEAGYTEDQIVEAQRMMDESGVDYLVNANPLARLAQANMDWYEKHRVKKTRGGDISPDDDDYGNLLPITIPGRIY